MLRKLRNSPLLLVLLVAGCGGSSQHPLVRTQLVTEATTSCVQAIDGKGSMGSCAPKRIGLDLGPVKQVGGITFPDLSNNDPCFSCAAAIKAHGHVGEIDKANQGPGFTDSTFVSMIQDAKAHGLAVGGYDFDEQYTAAETYKYIARSHAAGIYRDTPNTFPPTIDVEFGNFSKEGLQHQINILFREFGRVNMYTGGWYALPHFGCWWPAHVTAWLSGYPNATIFCGLSEFLYKNHQFTDRGYIGVPGHNADMSVFRGTQKQFDEFVHKSKPKPTAAQKKEALHKLYKRRKELRALRALHGCAKGHTVTPNTRAYKRQKCPGWTRHGNEVKASIKKLHKAGVF